MNNNNMEKTNNKRSKKSGIFKIISIVLIATFFVQNIVWANPEIGQENTAFNTLQVQLLFAPLVNPRLQHKALLKLPLDYVIKKIGKSKIDKFDIKLTPKLFLNNSKNVIQTSGKVTLPQYRDENGEYVNVVLDFEGKWKSNKHLFLPCAIKYKGFPSWKYVAKINPETLEFVLEDPTTSPKPHVQDELSLTIKKTDKSVPRRKAKSAKKKPQLKWQERAEAMRKIETELLDILAMKKLSDELKEISNMIDQGKTRTAIVACESILRSLGTQMTNEHKTEGVKALNGGLQSLKDSSLVQAKNSIRIARGCFIERQKQAEEIVESVRLWSFGDVINDAYLRNKRIIEDFILPIREAASTGNFKKCRDLLRRSTKEFMSEPEFRMLLPLTWAFIREKKGNETFEEKRGRVEDITSKFEWLVKASSESNKFMREFENTLVKRVISESIDYRYLQEEVFRDTFQKFYRQSNLVRGSPGRFWTMLYRAAFVSLEIDNPSKPSERISNPLFKTVDALVLIKLAGDFIMLTGSRNFSRQNPETTNILKKFANEEKNKFTNLTKAERRRLFMTLVKDHKLDIVDSIKLWAVLSRQEFEVINDMPSSETLKIENISIEKALDMAKREQLFLKDDGQFHYSDREDLLKECGVYDDDRLYYLHKLHKKYLRSNLKRLTQYEQVELWSYMVLMKIEKERYKSLETAVMAARKRMGDDVLSEIDDLYIGYDWPTKLSTVELDKKIDFLTKKTGMSRLKPNFRIYSIGCNGETLMSIAAKYPSLKFVGLDASPISLGRAIDELQKRKKEGKLVDNIQFRLADCRPRIKGVPQRGIPADNNSVDMVMITEGAMEDSEYESKWMEQLWEEMLRIAKKPGAKIVFIGRKGEDEFYKELEKCGMEEKNLFYNSKFAVSPWQSDSFYRKEYITAFVYELKERTNKISPSVEKSPQSEDPEQSLFSFEDDPALQSSEVLVDLNLGVPKEVKAELAVDPVIGQEDKDVNPENIPQEMVNKFMSALLSTAMSKKKVFLLFSENLKTKEAINNVYDCIDILKKDNLFGEFLEGVEREELTPGALQKRALDLKDREDVLVFTYAPESDKDELGKMNDWAAKTRNTNINPAYINEEGLNEKETIKGEFYYPIFEMVTLSLINYLTRETAGGVFGVLKAMNIDPAKFNLRINDAVDAGDRSNIMFFVIVPVAKKYNTEDRRNRYEELRHILRYL